MHHHSVVTSSLNVLPPCLVKQQHLYVSCLPAGFQAFADPDTGAVTAVDADMSFNSSSVRLVVVGRGPLGAFTAKVSAVQMEGRLWHDPMQWQQLCCCINSALPPVRVTCTNMSPAMRSRLGA
jgi:hypothetical protein